MVALRPGGIHAVVHLAGDGLELADLLVPGGRIASTLGLSGDQLDGRAVQVTPVMALPVSRILGRLAADVVYGQLTVPVSGLKRWPTSPGRLLISPRAPGIAARSGAVPLSSPPPLFH